jgi:hypothetical protein
MHRLPCKQNAALGTSQLPCFIILPDSVGLSLTNSKSDDTASVTGLVHTPVTLQSCLITNPWQKSAFPP